MKPYNKKEKKGKFEKEKLNKKTGVLTKTKSSVLEAKNANRSLKKGIRQESKKEIRKDVYLDNYDEEDDDDFSDDIIQR